MFNIYSMKICVLLHFEHKNDIMFIVKLLYGESYEPQASSFVKFDNDRELILCPNCNRTWIFVEKVIFNTSTLYKLPGDPKLLMTSQFPQKSWKRYLLDSRLHNKGEEKKENELVFFRNLTLFESKLSRCFLLLSFLSFLFFSFLFFSFL